MRKLLAVLSSFLVVAPLSSCTEQRAAASSTQPLSCQAIEIAGRTYFFPAEDDEFLATNFDDSAEVGLPHHFWMDVYETVREVRGWLAWDNGVLTPAYLTEPNDIFEWQDRNVSDEPPVRGPVELEEVRTGYNIWRSHDPEIKPPVRYATFDSDPSVYVVAFFDELDDPDEGLDLIWNDNGILHRLNLPGDWVSEAPTVASAYAGIVKKDCRTEKGRDS